MALLWPASLPFTVEKVGRERRRAEMRHRQFSKEKGRKEMGKKEASAALAPTLPQSLPYACILLHL